MIERRTFDFTIRLVSDPDLRAMAGDEGRLATSWFELVTSGDWEVRDRSSGFRIETPGFPDRPGFRIEGDDQSFEVHSDRAGLASAFWATLGEGDRVIVSTRLAEVEVGGRRLDGEVLEEVALLGHVLGDRTAVDGIRRTTTTSGVVWVAGKGGRSCRSPIESLVEVTPNPSLGDLLEGIGSVGDAGEAIELTGGLDSRLLLAARTLAGRKPRMAITFGSRDHPDVVVAARLADAFGLAHRIIPFGEGHDDLANRAAFNGAQSGGSTDLKQYAAFLGPFDRLAREREEQIGGAGGELAVDFYDVPGLTTLATRGAWMPLIRRRFIQVPRIGAEFGTDGLRAAIERVAIAVRETLEGYSDPNPYQRLRRFYCEERLANWAGPVLNANRYEYTPLTPLLHVTHAAWANSLGREQRQGRRAQEDLLVAMVERHGLDRAATEIPYAGPRRGVAKVLSWGGKLLRRIGGIDPRASMQGRLVLDAWEADERIARAIASVPEVRIFGARVAATDLLRMSEATNSLSGVLLGGMAAVTSNDLPRRNAFPPVRSS